MPPRMDGASLPSGISMHAVRETAGASGTHPRRTLFRCCCKRLRDDAAPLKYAGRTTALRTGLACAIMYMYWILPRRICWRWGKWGSLASALTTSEPGTAVRSKKFTRLPRESRERELRFGAPHGDLEIHLCCAPAPKSCYMNSVGLPSTPA